MPEIELLSQVYLKLGGSDAPSDLVAQVKSVEVDQNLHLPNMFRIQIQDPELRWIDSDLIKIGQEVEVNARSLERQRAWLITGEVTAIEPDFPEEGVPTVEVRGYDKLHLLQRGTRSRTFVEMTDSDIASRIASDHGLRADATSTRTVHPHIYQNNVTDLEFLRERAARIGYVVRAERSTLLFKPFREAGSGTVELQYGTSLLEFRPRVTAASQADAVVVRGWDYKDKKAVESEQNPSQWPNASGLSSQDASRAFGGEAKLISAGDDMSQASFAAAVSSGLKSAVEESKVRADGLALGNTAIHAGCTVSLDAVGTRFRGDYFVTSARHRFDTRGRYETEFSVTGHYAETTRELLFGAPPREARGRSRLSEAVIGIVSNNEDPEGLGRVKVRFPWLAEDEESGWARVASPMAGAERGFFNLPEIDDEVLVAFVDGSFNEPVVVGALWNGRDKPPEVGSAVDGGEVVKRIWRTRAGHQILLDDTSGSEKIQIVDKSGNNEIVIDTAGGAIKLSSQQSVELDTRGEVTVKATSDLKLEGANIEITASGRVKVSGAMVELN